LDGHVRLAVNELIGYYFLPEAISAFQREFPSIEVEILISNGKVNLNKRDADISICQNKPEQPDLVVAHLVDKPLGFFVKDNSHTETTWPSLVRQYH
ncbi:LysR substrate-binding domain-containing protein, partial [Pseudomonadota bacterium]